MAGRQAEYRLTPEAEYDLDSIWLYSYRRWGLRQAHHYVDELIAAFSELAEQPQRGNCVENIRPGYRRHMQGRHAIYYRITDYGIAVIRILHGQMLPNKHLPQVNEL